MNDIFENSERLYCAVFPPEYSEVVSDMQKRFIGRVVRLYVKNCVEIGAVTRYMPTKTNPYHSEIHGSQDTVLLSKSQRRHLAKKGVVI